MANTAAARDLQAIFVSAKDAVPILRLPKGHVVFRQGDHADAVFYIISGEIQMTVVSKQGKECVISQSGPGDFFGEGCLASQRVRVTTAAAATAVEIVRLSRKTMGQLLDENPILSHNFMTFMVLRNIRVEEDLIDQLFNSSEKRLARLLLLLANYNTSDESFPVIPKISQDVLARRIGTTRGRINFFMNKFRKLGMIEYNGHLKVNKSLLNVIVHD